MAHAAMATKRAPWHLWLVGIILLFWFASGAVTIIAAQHFGLADMQADEVAYYAAKPLWLELVTDLGLFACVSGAIGLLLRRAWAAPAFMAASVLVVAQNFVELANGTSRVYANNVAAVVTAVIVLSVLAGWLYARAMVRRGVLA